jgi:hypothetical protein
MVGGLSDTITLKVVHEAWLPALSLAEHETAVVPRSNVLPDAGLHDDDAIPELSTAAKVHVGLAVGVLPLVGMMVNGEFVEYGGHVSVGAVLSTLLMEKKQVDDFPAMFVAVQLMLLIPRAVNTTGLGSMHV